jgi:MFS family permease
VPRIEKNNPVSANSDIRLLFATRIVRMFAYGLLAVILALYLAQVGLSDAEIGLLLTLTLLGDTAVSLWITTRADRRGRKRMLLIGAGLMVFAGVVFAATGNFYLLLIAATAGVISPSGGEVGPFLAIEQSALAQNLASEKRTQVLAWYQLAGSLATALGSLTGGALTQILQNGGTTPLASYRVGILAYGALGFVLAAMFGFLSPRIEAVLSERAESRMNLLGLGRSSAIVIKLAALFSLDAFAGGFVVQAIVAYWFHVRYGVSPGVLGAIFFGANIFAGISALSAAWIARKIGLVNTMVFTHVPSNVLLILVPLMPNLPLAITMLLLRFSISQMDVPTRQSYTLAVVSPEERSSTAGVTGIARTLGASLAPVFSTPLISIPALAGAPFIIAGILKLIYDWSLYRSFKTVKPQEEQTASS